MLLLNIYTIYLQDLHSLRNGSLDYSQADEPTYRVCVEESKNLGNTSYKVEVRLIDLKNNGFFERLCQNYNFTENSMQQWQLEPDQKKKMRLGFRNIV